MSFSANDGDPVTERDVKKALAALVRAHQDARSSRIREDGMDERDMALASGLLSPAEIEAPFYSLSRRWRMILIIEEMGARGWIEVKMK